eukprot:Filipodium_phascolosomae@DN1007_c0_g1_i2.p1
MFCVGGVCFSAWHLILLVGVIFKPIFSWIVNLFYRKTPQPTTSRSKISFDKTDNAHLFLVNTNDSWNEIVGLAKCKNHLPIIVDFTAEWCTPCRKLKPLFEKLSKDFTGRAVFAIVDIDKCDEVAVQFGVAALPTLMAYGPGHHPTDTTGAVKSGEAEMNYEIKEKVVAPSAGCAQAFFEKHSVTVESIQN